MRITKYILTALASVFLAASCYEDKGNYDYTDIGDIVINGLDDEYVFFSQNDRLQINPVIATDMNTADLEYTWVMRYSVDDTDIDTLQHGPNPNLDHDPIDRRGTFHLYYYIKNTKAEYDDYFVHTRIPVTLTSPYSDGLYLLKETTDGNTDMDLLRFDKNFFSNVIADIHGQPLQGRPRNLGVLYGRPYLEPVTEKKVFNNCLGVVTHDNVFNVLTTVDLAPVFDDYGDMFWEGEMPDGGIPQIYRFNTGRYGDEMIASNGLFSCSPSYAGAGKMNHNAPDEGVSPDAGDMWAWWAGVSGSVYWNDTERCLMYSDYGTPAAYITDNLSAAGADYECLYLGANGSVMYTVLHERASDKTFVGEIVRESVVIIDPDYEYLLDFGFTIDDMIAFGFAEEVVSVFFKTLTEAAAGSALNDAMHFANLEFGTNMLFFATDDNDLYYIDMGLKSGSGLALTAHRLNYQPTAGYDVSHIVHLHFEVNGSFWSDTGSRSFSYFSIATHNSATDEYKAEMYSLAGGLPELGRAPMMKAEGSGKIHSIKYVDRFSKFSPASFDDDASGEAVCRWNH